MPFLSSVVALSFLFLFQIGSLGAVQLLLRAPGVYVSSIREGWVLDRESWRPLRESPVSWVSLSDSVTRSTLTWNLCIYRFGYSLM